MTPQLILQAAYDRAASQSQTILSDAQKQHVSVIVAYAEQQKAVLAALMTSLTKKIDAPEQDIRQHQIGLEGGYSGRVYDTNYVTPFIRQKFRRFAMLSGSGWLTRSIEQNHAYTLDFPGRIAVKAVKEAFLTILDDVETTNASPEEFLVALFTGLLTFQKVDVGLLNPPTPSSVFTVQQVLERLQRHFSATYTVSGASRLPVLALFAINEILMGQYRYADKHLAPLKSHRTSDQKSRTIGDIEILNDNGTFFEAIEVKHQIPISLAMVEDAYEKIRTHSVERYLLLTTAEPNTHEAAIIAPYIEQIRQIANCEIIVNGVIPTLKYTLRLVESPAVVLIRYTDLLREEYLSNTDIKRQHLEMWTEVNR